MIAHGFDRLDIIGITGFAYDFGSLEDNSRDIVEVFDAMGRVQVGLFTLVGIFLGNRFPALWKCLPNDTRSHHHRFKKIMETVGATLIENTRKEMEEQEAKGGENDSIMGKFRK